MDLGKGAKIIYEPILENGGHFQSGLVVSDLAKLKKNNTFIGTGIV